MGWDGEAELAPGAVTLLATIRGDENPYWLIVYPLRNVVQTDTLTLVTWVGDNVANLGQPGRDDELWPTSPLNGAAPYLGVFLTKDLINVPSILNEILRHPNSMPSPYREPIRVEQGRSGFVMQAPVIVKRN